MSVYSTGPKSTYLHLPTSSTPPQPSPEVPSSTSSPQHTAFYSPTIYFPIRPPSVPDVTPSHGSDPRSTKTVGTSAPPQPHSVLAPSQPAGSDDALASFFDFHFLSRTLRQHA
ncbi:hypothetical protein BJ508DRAFT_359736 [Ascobolus immersus RN42]|uniref:Uncharacterized protein n=1 Tax=Ascobolus immersus RN42 TaxID=1160509 RepID=A0A3N4IFI4_ASCIM|nr:hypothetical protein BJ508DRAFT_359736 [Ascobolus immersus RN42]